MGPIMIFGMQFGTSDTEGWEPYGTKRKQAIHVFCSLFKMHHEEFY